MVILLDAGPLGLISNPKAMEVANECRGWMREQIARGVRFCLPEIVDYEIRRELLRGNKVRGLARLDLLNGSIWYLSHRSAPVAKELLRFETHGSGLC